MGSCKWGLSPLIWVVNIYIYIYIIYIYIYIELPLITLLITTHDPPSIYPYHFPRKPLLEERLPLGPHPGSRGGQPNT